MSLSDKRKEFIKIPERKLSKKLESGYYYGEDVREAVERIQSRINEDMNDEEDNLTPCEIAENNVRKEIIQIINEEAGDKWKLIK